MPQFYVRYRKRGPVGVYTVTATTREAAIALVRNSAAVGEEFDVMDVNVYGYEITGVSGPTGP